MFLMKLKILSKTKVAKNVHKFRLEKPEGFTYTSNQVMTLGAPEKKKAMYTITSNPNENFIEFIIKSYLGTDGASDNIGKLQEGDIIVAGNPFGGMQDDDDILFIAGGSGITPFIAHLRNHDSKNNYCLASYNLKEDIIEEDYIKSNSSCEIFLSEEDVEGYSFGRIAKKDIEKVVVDKNFEEAYVCGPSAFEDAMINILEELGVKGKKIY